jgi:bifunctional non-homologous end joining protein LigD
MLRPMLAAPAARVPTGPEWVHEVKWDGIRVLADVVAGQVRLYSRNGREITQIFPELGGLGGLFEDMLLDGEVVAMRSGVPSFAGLMERFGVANAARAGQLAARKPITYMVFDLLRLYGVDLTARSFADRRATLERLELAGGPWRVPPLFTDGALLLEATREQGLEGIVSKRLGSRYAAGVRSEDWVKKPHRSAVSVVIGGWRPETDQTQRLGSVLVGVPAPGGLRYLGKVGSGLAGRTGAALLTELRPLGPTANPFVDPIPAEDSIGTTWVHPVLVCDVQTLGMTHTARLRQPAYKGLRPDLTAGDVDPAEVPVVPDA